MRARTPKAEPVGPVLWRRRRRLLTIWVLLLLLVALTVTTAYIPLGVFNMALNILIAAVKVVLVGVFFMHLAEPQVVPRMICVIAGVMLVVMFSLSGIDFVTRDGKGGHPPAVSH